MPRRTVLVVEDDADLRSIFAANLTIAGFIVREAANGMDALRLIDSGPPGLVVLDLGLPHVSGQDVLYELKQHPHTREIPILVVTGRDGAVAPGVDDDCILMKPVHPAELVRQVKRCLGLQADSGL